MVRNLFHIVFLASCNVLFAQNVAFEHITIDDGLSQNSVFAVVRDASGKLWIGTLDGINIYDGYSFTALRNDAADSNSLSANNVVELYSSSSGKIITLYQNSDADIIDPKTLRATHFSSLIGKSPSSIGKAFSYGEDSLGNMYVSYRLSLFRFSTKDSTHSMYSFPAGENPLHQIKNVALYNDSTMLVLTPHTLYFFNSNSGAIHEIPVRDEKIGKSFHTAYSELEFLGKDRHNIVWIFGGRKGLCFLNTRTMTIEKVVVEKKTERFLQNVIPRTQLFDSFGNFWLGTDSGLVRFVVEYNDNNIPAVTGSELYQHNPANSKSISNNNILSLYEDKERILWVGTTNGLNKTLLSKKKFLLSTHDIHNPNSLGDGSVWTILQDYSGRVWVGTHSGLYVREKNSSTYKKIPSIRPVSMLEDSNHTLWFGTREGLFHITGRDTKPQYFFDSASTESSRKNFIYSLLQENRTTLWLGTSDGLAKFDLRKHTFHRFFYDTISHAKLRNTIMSLCLSSDGFLWLGTNGGGVIRMNTTDYSYKVFPPDASNPYALHNGVVSCIYESKEKTLWIATLAGGLNKLEQIGDSVRFIQYNEKSNLKTNMVYSILEDDEANLWLGTVKGLVKFSPKNKIFRIYRKSDGIINDEFNQNAYFKANDGKLFFGASNGMMEFYPKDISESEFVPAIVLTQFKVFDKEYTPLLQDSIITLSHDQNFFSFEFSSLSLVHPQANLYAHKLEGVDEKFSEPSNRRFVQYTNINPGEYFFTVKGTNSDGIWNEQGTSIRIIITPPWWATLWFRILVFFCFVGSISGGAWYISRRKLRLRIIELEKEQAVLEERQRTRDKIARDLHDDLASTVGSAGLFVEAAKRTLSNDATSAHEFLTKTGSILNEAEEAMSDIVWSVSPKHDTLQSLATRIRVVTNDVCRANGITHKLLMQGISEISIPDYFRRGLYLIFKESLYNCIKHAEAKEITITFTVQENIVLLSIADNGKGFSMENNREGIGGNGMSNMRNRAKEIDAVLEIHSEVGKGTVVVVKKKMGK